MIIIILSMIFGTLLTVYIALAMAYRSTAKKNPKITYKQFLKLYKMNPIKWDLMYEYVLYKREDLYYGIYFSTYLDCLKYQWMLRQKENNETKRQVDQDMIVLLEEWQNDIGEYRKQYMDLLKELNGKEK